MWTLLQASRGNSFQILDAHDLKAREPKLVDEYGCARRLEL